MHLKKGDKSKAIQTYTDVADMFSRGGFDAKAVAIYKQILRVEEESLEARTRLGECFQRMGLTSDALREFQDAFKICQKRELKREAFELLRRVASLDPSNIANRLNLAGLFAREGMQDDARREFTSLLEEVRRQSGTDLVVRVAEQMLHAFPDSRDALDALAWAKLASGAHAEAVKLLKPVIAKFPDDIPLRESLVNAYEGAGDATAAKRLWREIAEMYKRRGDVEKSRDILQRHAVMEEFSAGEENTTPSILLTDSTGRTLQDDDELLELDDPAPARPAPAKPVTPPRPAALVERGRAAPPPNRAGPLPSKPLARPPVAQAQESAADLIAEARVSLEFGDPEEASRLARRVLELEPGSRAARDLLAEASQLPETENDAAMPGLLERNALEESDELTIEPVAPPSVQAGNARPEIEALAPGEDFDTLPDIEIVLEDEEDRDEKFASVEPPLSLELNRDPAPSARKTPTAKPAPAPIAAKAPAPKLEDSLDIEIEIEGEGVEEDEGEDEALSLEFSKPLASEQEASFGDASAKITENLSEADFYLEQGLVDEAARIYQSVLERVPHHPKAMLRMGEIEAKRKKKPAGRAVAPADLDAAFGDTMVREPDGREALSLPEIEEPIEELDFEPSVVGEDTIPPIEELEPAPSDELVFAEDSGAPLDLDPELATEDDDALHETSESVEGEGEFDLAAMLDEDEHDSTGSIGTLIGVGSVGKGFAEVFSAFKKGIQAQVDEGDADTHYDLAIAYKEMGLNEDAVRELETVLRTGTRATESLSLLASCKLALGDAGAAAAHLEDALGRAGDSHESAVSLRYDLGEALLAAGRDREALEAFKKVAAADPDFRDVVERISRFG